MVSIEQGKTIVKNTQSRNIADRIIRLILGILLFLSAIPPLINPITIPIVALAIIVSIYLLVSRKNHRKFEIFIFMVAFALFAIFGGNIFNEMKALLLYAPPINNELIGFLLFAPVLVMLLISAAYLLAQGIIPKIKKHESLENLVIFAIITSIIFVPIFIKNIEVMEGNLTYGGYGGIKKIEASLEINSNRRFIYTLKETNPDDKPIDIVRIFGNKQEISFDGLLLEGTSIKDNRLEILPNSTAKITILATEPFFIITMDIENQFPPPSFDFFK